MPLRVFEFFPYSESLIIFRMLVRSGYCGALHCEVRVGYGCQMLYVVLEDVPTFEHYCTTEVR